MKVLASDLLSSEHRKAHTKGTAPKTCRTSKAWADSPVAGAQ